MSLKKIEELLKLNEKDSVFSFEEIWKHPISINKKYRTYLAPDSYAYHSVINPVFSFELEGHDFADLRKFSLVSLRDGVYPLVRFFYLNPEPKADDPYLIIDSRLEKLIPVKWKPQCILRELFVNRYEVESSELLVLISPDKDSLPLDVVKASLDKIKDYGDISVYFSSCNSYGEEDPEYDSSWSLKILQSLYEILPESKIRVIDFAQYNAKKVKGSRFYFLNPFKYYFSDSYLMHDLLQRGAIPLEGFKLKNDQDVNVHISAHHGFALRHCQDNEEIVPGDFLGDKIFKREVFRAPAGSSLEKLKLSTKEFKDWASATARHLYVKKYL